ncbi:MAG: lysophospholipid acyltransferase family protein [Tepidisphaerales bacterium]
MQEAISPGNRLWSLSAGANGLLARLLAPAVKPAERLLCVDRINSIYDNARGAPDWRQFVVKILDQLDVQAAVSDQDLQRIPKTGPCVVVANHPFGAVEGMMLPLVLSRVRNDVKVLANRVLGRITELCEVMILTDVFGGDAAAARNLGATRQAVRHLKNGGLLVVFPAGEVSHLQLSLRCVSDPEWKESVAGIARLADAPVLPVFIGGGNSRLFHLAGLLHPALRTAMLAREVFQGAHRRIPLGIGTPISARQLAGLPDDRSRIEYCRRRTYAMAHRSPSRPLAPKQLVPVIDPSPVASQEREVASLGDGQKLMQHREFVAYVAEPARIPTILREIGRLREIAFRAEGEGTGRPFDLDGFDGTYQHLFIWNKLQREVVGAYRLGLTDVILRNQGPKGLYTTTLFNYGPELMQRISPAIELGRSFVRVEYQRNFVPLFALWRGIGEFVARNPQYRWLFGPVSISAAYSPASRELMRQFLADRFGGPEFSGLVRPVRPPVALKGVGQIADSLSDLDDLAAVVSDIESDAKSVPVLVRQYLKLGARFLSFNIDHQFNDAMDGLIVVDLLASDPRVIEKYMGSDGQSSFYRWHGRTSDDAVRVAKCAVSV